MKKTIFLALGMAALGLGAAAQQPITEQFARFLTEPNGYVCYRVNGPIKVDGVLNEADWANAPFTESFVDISGDGFAKPRFDTKAKMLWDDEYLYVAAVLEEPHVWADIKQRDAVVYYNNDFEVFIDPTGDAHNYFEVETNAIGTVFDLEIEKPYRAPNTRTFAQFQWNCPGLKLATKVQGSINKSSDTDKGWTVELAIPRTAIAGEFDNYLKAGNYLRVGFSRVEWQHDLDSKGKYSRKKDDKGNFLPEDNWTWGPTGMIAMHMPERWGYVYLSGSAVGKGSEQFAYPASRPVERLLWAMFYAQEKQYEKAKRYFNSVYDFHLTEAELATLPNGSRIDVEAISHKYEIAITTPDGKQTVIDEAGQIYHRENK